MWGTRLASMEDTELTLEQFKQFIVVLAAQEQLRGEVKDGNITPADAGRMAVHAFRLLDTDQSETISFKEFEVRGLSTEHAANTQNDRICQCCLSTLSNAVPALQDVWSVYKVLKLLHGNNVLRQELVLEQGKRKIALLDAKSTDQARALTETAVADKAQFDANISPVQKCHGHTFRQWDFLSLWLCLGHSMALAFHSSRNAGSEKDRIVWIGRTFTSLHFVDAVSRLVGQMQHPSLTEAHRQVGSTC